MDDPKGPRDEAMKAAAYAAAFQAGHDAGRRVGHAAGYAAGWNENERCRSDGTSRPPHVPSTERIEALERFVEFARQYETGCAFGEGPSCSCYWCSALRELGGME